MPFAAVDIETEGLITFGNPPRIICVSITTATSSDCYEWNEKTLALINTLAQSHTFIFHNAVFDCVVLTQYGAIIPSFHDTMLMSYVMEPGALHFHSLRYWGDKLGLPKLEKPWEGNYPTKYTEDLANYCMVDTQVTYKLFFHFLELFDKDREAFSFYLCVELPYCLVIMEMQAVGMHVNKDELQRLSSELKLKLVDLEQHCVELCPLAPGAVKKYKKPHEDKVPPQWVPIGLIGNEWCYQEMVTFNPSSNSQKAYALKHLYGWEPLEFTKTGDPQVSAEILKDLPHPLAETLVEHATVSKIVSSFLDPFYTYTDENNVLRGNFNQTITKTGRLSSSQPNMQNIPARGELGKKMRNIITVPSDDVVLFNGDLSNIEARVLAWMLYYYVGDESMMQSFLRGEDFHSGNAKNWGVDRVTAKTLFFAILYGAGILKIAKQLRRSYYEAKTLVAKLHESTPTIQMLKEAFWEQAEQNDGLIHTLLGRRLCYPDINSRKTSLKSAAQRRIFNGYIQGTSGDVLKCVTLECMPTIRANNAMLAASVHDELLGYVPKKNAERLCAELTHVFSESQFIAPIPIVAEFKFGTQWGALKSA